MSGASRRTRGRRFVWRRRSASWLPRSSSSFETPASQAPQDEDDRGARVRLDSGPATSGRLSPILPPLKTKRRRRRGNEHGCWTASGGDISRARHRHVVDQGAAGRRATSASLGETSAALTLSRPHPLWSEQNPATGPTASRTRSRRSGAIAPRSVRAPRRRRPVRPDAWRDVLLDGADNVAAPGDPVERRPRPSPNAPNSSGACPIFRQRAGNIAMPGFTAPKLLWVAAHEPRGLRRRPSACCCPRTMCACG